MSSGRDGGFTEAADCGRAMYGKGCSEVFTYQHCDLRAHVLQMLCQEGDRLIAWSLPHQVMSDVTVSSEYLNPLFVSVLSFILRRSLCGWCHSSAGGFGRSGTPKRGRSIPAAAFVCGIALTCTKHSHQPSPEQHRAIHFETTRSLAMPSNHPQIWRKTFVSGGRQSPAVAVVLTSF